MKYLHTMVRVTDIEQSLRFYRDALGLSELSRRDYPQGRYTLVFLAAPGDDDAQVELTHNWDPEAYPGGRNFGHLAYADMITGEHIPSRTQVDIKTPDASEMF